MIMFASEVPHTLQTRGVYRTRSWYRDVARNPQAERLEVPNLTDDELFTGFDPHYQSSYDNAMVRISCRDSWRRTSTLPWFCGEFRWTGFDYIGECYGWPAKSWNFGIIDLCGFPKDAYYFYQSQWTQEPMVHLLPDWTWPGLEGKVIPVQAYSNCDRVELFLNDRSLGMKEREDPLMPFRWDVPYRPGVLRATGYRQGRAVSSCCHQTAGEPAALRLQAEEPAVRADRTGVIHVSVAVVDASGQPVPRVNPDIRVDVSGPGRLVGLENGDPLDTSNYKLNHRRAFHGRMLAVVQAGDQEGTIVVTARSDGLGEAACRVEAASSPGMA
jgi:beta-galactosidase